MELTVKLVDSLSSQSISFTENLHPKTDFYEFLLLWIEGNNSCDCNRSMLLWDDSDKQLPCNNNDNQILAYLVKDGEEILLNDIDEVLDKLPKDYGTNPCLRKN